MILIYSLLLSAHVYHHYWMIEKKKMRPNYLLENIKRTLAILFLSFVGASVETKGIYWIDISRWAFLYYSIFFLTFDYSLNIIRGKKFFYQGDGIGDTITDKILKKIGPLGSLALKIIILALSVFTFYYFKPVVIL